MTASTSSTAIYVGDLDRLVAEKVLFEVFSKFGSVISTRVCRDSMTRESLGYGYVNFTSHEAAAQAVDMSHIEINGKTCRVMWSIRDPVARKSGVNNVHVSGLPPSMQDSQSLQDLFSAFGNITSAKLVVDENGVSKGYAYVDFENNESAREAVAKLHEAVIDDCTIRVAPFVPQSVRHATEKWTNVYVKNIPLTWTEDDLKTTFAKYGNITSLKINCEEDGKSKGHGFVNFEQHEDAKNAVDNLHDMVVEGEEGKKLYVSRHQKKEERRRELKQKTEADKAERSKKYQNMNLYVRNIADSLTDDQFRDMFAPFGRITSARIMRDPSGASRGFGFVCYTTPDEAQKAIVEMNTKQVGTKPLYVRLYEKKENRVPMPPLGMYHHFPSFGYPPAFMAAAPKGARRNAPRMGMPMAPAIAAPVPVAAPAPLVIQEAKNQMGSLIYPVAVEKHGELAGKLTGMLLELEYEELSMLVKSPEMLHAKLSEAKAVLDSAN